MSISIFRSVQWSISTVLLVATFPLSWNLSGIVPWTNRHHLISKFQFSSVQSLSRVRLFATPWIAACQASLSITNSRSPLRLTSIESVMPSSHLILCCLSKFNWAQKPVKLSWRKLNRNMSLIRNIFNVLTPPVTSENTSVAHGAFKNLCKWWSKCVFQVKGNSSVRALLLDPNMHWTKEGKMS